ncbi:hypothetical protein CIT292_06004 [Citrobacter youngae ATCC 29220]|uniref:Uncharacterized protein n=1 Tax=Citrobacter youngae ATCC 29220 TaxID=500640 RepID=D4B6R5_9ENTR|nr:hypothetical protein CIT292_06004 [Citrobacter youngae ATCC 29220]
MPGQRLCSGNSLQKVPRTTPRRSEEAELPLALQQQLRGLH